MAPKKKSPLRLIVPIVVLLAGLGIAYAFAVNSSRQAASRQQQGAPVPPREAPGPGAQGGVDQAPGEPAGAAPGTAPGTAPDTAPEAGPARQPSDPPAGSERDPGPGLEPGSDPGADVASAGASAGPSAGGASGAAAGPIAGLTARVLDTPGAFTPIGSLVPGADDRAHLEFSQVGAGIRSLTLPSYFETVAQQEYVELQHEQVVSGIAATPMALLAVVINGERVVLDGIAAPVWREIAPGSFEATIENEAGDAVARVVRDFKLTPGSYELELENRLINLTDEPMTVVFEQTGPIDLRPADNRYGGDKRRFRFGYLLKPEAQGADPTVSPSGLNQRAGKRILGGKVDRRYEVARTIWPTETTARQGHRLVWLSVSDRYFSVALHAHKDPSTFAAPEDKLFDTLDHVDRLVLNPAERDSVDVVMLIRLVSTELAAPPGARAAFNLGIYAGPLDTDTINANPLAAALGLDRVVEYNFGGPCAFCTFGWLTELLYGVLNVIHSFTYDWAIAIIFLVFVVRGILHPITRWSQIRMQRFGVQMQAVAPKMKKLREKYKDEPKKLQQEMTKLYREEGVNPAGFLGCLPMLLQSPVWIALYATLFFAFDMRHQPAFYGVFQTIAPDWKFLADLSAPDNAIPLPSALHFSMPLWGQVSSVNVLPMLLAVVFFLHQKYLTPPTTGTLTPEQEQQQKIMKVMMVGMFPIFMYTAPSGLALYFVTNSTIGILENKWIRAHMDKKGMLDPDKIKAERTSKKSFMQRLAEAAEKRQQAMHQAKGGAPGAGRAARGMYRQSKPEPKQRSYKKRK